MFKIFRILPLIFLITFTSRAISHIKHYDDLNRIEFDIYRNNQFIGKHIFSFKRFDDKLKLSVKSEINFEIKKFGVVLYTYHVEGTEI